MKTTSTTSTTFATFPSSATKAVSFAARLLLAAIFLVSGFGKLANPNGTIGYITSVGLPAPMLGYLVALLVEIGGGILLVLGYRTRWAAAILAAFSIVSALIFHNALGDQNQLFHFLKNVAMAGGLLQVVAFGSGSYSIDKRTARAGH